MLDVGIPGLGKFPRLNPRTLQCLIVYLAIFSHGGALGRDIPDARSPRSLLALEDSGIFLSSSCGPPGSLLQVSGVPPSGPECPLLRCTYQWEDAGQGGTSMRTAVVDGELLAAPAGANSTCDFLCHLPDASVLGSGYGSLLIHVTVQLANSDASLELDFTITEWVTQTFITPAYGPLGNPTLVEISSALEGVPFPEACGVAAIICRFGEVMAHGTYDEASGRLTCTAPSQVATDILLAQDTAALADASAAGITAAMRAEHGGAAFRHYPVLLSLSFDDGLSFTTLGVYLYYEPPLVLLWRGAPWLGAAVAPEGELLNDPSNWRPIKVPSSEDVAVLAPPADTLPLLALVTSSMSLRQLILASRCSHLLCADSDTATIAPSVHPVTLRLSSELALGTGGLKVGYGGHVELAGPAAVLNLTHATSGATVGGGGLMTWRAGTLASGTGGGDPASVNVTALASLRLDPAGMLWLAHGLALWVHGTMDVPPAPQVAWMAGEGLLGVAPAGKVQVAGSLLRLSVPLVLQPGSSLRVQPAGVTNATRAASRETSTKSKEMSKNEAQREIPGGDGKEIEETPGGDGKGNPAGIGKATSGGDGRQTEPMVVGGEGEAVDERTDWSFSPAGTRHRTRRSLLLLRGGGGGSGEDDSQHPSGHLRPTGLFTLARRSLVAAMGGHSPVVTSPWPRTAPPPVAEGPTGGNPMVGSTQVMSRGIDPSQVVESMTMESSQTGASDQQGRPAPSTLKLASVPKLARAREGQPVKSQHRDAHGNLPGVPHQTPHQTDILEVGSHMGRGLRKDLPSRSLAHGAQRRRLAAETASGTFASVIATSGNLSNAAAALVLDAAGSSLLEGDVYAGARCVVVLGGRGPVSLMRNQTVEGPGLLLLRSEAAAGFVFEGSVRVDHLWLDASAFRNSSEESAEPPRPLASFHQPSLSLVSLQITGGSLVSAGKSLETVHVSSLFGWSGGWIQDVSSLVLSGQALVLGGEDKVISGIRGTLMTITNGTLAWNSTGRLVGNATQIILGPGGAALFARGANLGIQHVRVDAGGLIQIPAPNGTDLNGVPLLVSTTPFIVHISGNLTLAERAALVMSPGWRLQVDGHMSLMSPLTVRVRNESALVAGRSFPILQAVNGASFGPVGLRVESGMDCDPPRRTAFLTTYDAPTGTVTLTTSQDIHEACCRPGFYSIPNNTTSVTPSPATAPPPTSMPAPPPPASAMPPGDVGCLPCPAGTAGKIVGGRREDCVDCGIGAFSSVSGSTACTACPTGTYTLTVTATAAVECRECSLLLSDTSALAGLPLDFTTQLVAHCAIGPPAAPPPPPPPPADSSFWHLRDDNGKWNWELIIAVAVASGGGLLVLLVPLLLCCCHMGARRRTRKRTKRRAKTTARRATTSKKTLIRARESARNARARVAAAATTPLPTVAAIQGAAGRTPWAAAAMPSQRTTVTGTTAHPPHQLPSPHPTHPWPISQTQRHQLRTTTGYGSGTG
eukprot:jgi/Mesvir1/817/Mv17404-RA.1